MHNLLTVKETAEYLRIPLPTVYYLVQRGQLPAIQIGGRWRIKKDSLDRDILREQEQGQPTVLVIDDDTGVQGMFKLFLKKTGFSRMIVGTGKEGIAALKKQKFDLLFLDLMLPDTTGDVIYGEAQGTRAGPAHRHHHRLPGQRHAGQYPETRPGDGAQEAAEGRAGGADPEIPRP